MTYSLNGKQYLVIAAGGHGKLGIKQVTTFLLSLCRRDVSIPVVFARTAITTVSALTLLSAIFSQEGKFVTRRNKHFDVDLPDASLQGLLVPGIGVTPGDRW